MCLIKIPVVNYFWAVSCCNNNKRYNSTIMAVFQLLHVNHLQPIKIADELGKYVEEGGLGVEQKFEVQLEGNQCSRPA